MFVERTLAWLSKYRRLTIRYERRDDIHEAFLHLGRSLICRTYLSMEFHIYNLALRFHSVLGDNGSGEVELIEA